MDLRKFCTDRVMTCMHNILLKLETICNIAYTILIHKGANCETMYSLHLILSFFFDKQRAFPPVSLKETMCLLIQLK